MLKMFKLRLSAPYLFFILILIVSGLTGCASNQDSSIQVNQQQKESSSPNGEPPKPESRKILHELGETELIGIPERIIVLEFSYVDALTRLGISPIGIADDGKPELIIKEVKSKLGEYTSVGTRYEPNLEIISSLNPDLIIADLSNHKTIYENLQKIAPTLVYDTRKGGYSESVQSFSEIAKAVGGEQQAKEQIELHQQKMEQLKKLVSAQESRRVLPAVVSAKGFFGHSSTAYAGTLLEYIGFMDAVQSDEAYPKLSLEQLVEINPDVLFLMKVGESTVIDEWKSNPLWNEITAVKNNQIFEADRSTWSLFRGLTAAETITEEILQNLYPK